MSTYVEGFMPPDKKFLEMKAVWDACIAASVDPPIEVEEYFEGDHERAKADGAWVDVYKACEEWGDGDMRMGIVVHIEKLPPGIKTLRFVNSY